jgi:hypothetical protein
MLHLRRRLLAPDEVMLQPALKQCPRFGSEVSKLAFRFSPC